MMLCHRNRTITGVAVVLGAVIFGTIGCEPQVTGPEGDLTVSTPDYVAPDIQVAKPVKPVRTIRPPREHRTTEEKLAALPPSVQTPVNPERAAI